MEIRERADVPVDTTERQWPVEDTSIPSVAIGVIHPDYVHALFFKSLLFTVLTDNVEHNQMFGGRTIMLQSGVNIDQSRNQVVQVFLEQSDAEYLLFVDADQCWHAEDMFNFVRLAHADRRDVSSGVYQAYKGDRKIVPILPHTEYDDWMDPETVDMLEYPFKAFLVPAGALLISRDSLNKLSAEFGYEWFSTEATGMMEDGAFCGRCHALDVDVWVDPRFRLGHIKPSVL